MPKINIGNKTYSITPVLAICAACDKFIYGNIFNLRNEIAYPIESVWVSCKLDEKTNRIREIGSPLINDIYLCKDCLILTRKEPKNLDSKGNLRYL